MKKAGIESINYSFIPNHRETMEALTHSRLSAREFRAVIFIMNQTNGYLRPEDTINPDFFEERACISRPHLSNALSRLRQWNVITQNGRNFKVNPPKEWSPDALFTKNGEKRNSPKTVSHSPKTVNFLTENGEKQLPSKENLIENLTKENPHAPLRSRGERTLSPVKPFQKEAGAFLDWVSSQERIKFANRAKLMGLVRSTLVATGGTLEELQEWYHWVKQNDSYWGAREPPVIIGKAPDKFPAWLRDRKEGRVQHGEAKRHSGQAGYSQLPSSEQRRKSWGIK